MTPGGELRVFYWPKKYFFGPKNQYRQDSWSIVAYRGPPCLITFLTFYYLYANEKQIFAISIGAFFARLGFNFFYVPAFPQKIAHFFCKRVSLLCHKDNSPHSPPDFFTRKEILRPLKHTKNIQKEREKSSTQTHLI